MAVLNSPREDIASRSVIAVQEAQTRIKEAIIRSYKDNTNKDELTRELRTIINTAASEFDLETAKQVKTALAMNAQKWEYYYRSSMQIANANVLKGIQQLSHRNVVIHSKLKTYDIDLNEYIGLHPKEQNAIISQFRGYLTEDKRGLPIIKNYEKIVKNEIKKMAQNPANIYRVDKNGKPYKMNLRNFAEMKTRYEANLRDISKYAKQEATDLVWTSSHPDASGRCAPYQGKLYSISGKSGTIDNIKYTPLQDALLGPNADGNGIINGYNCRHRLIPYTSKSQPPQEYDKATIRKENQINNQQRLYERNIRNYKLEERALRANGNTQEASMLRKKWQNLTTSYKQYSFKNERAYYEWRTRVTVEEVDTYS